VGLGFCGANDPDKFVFNTRADQLALVYTEGGTGVPKRELFDDYNAARTAQANLAESVRAQSAIEIHSEGFKWLWLSQILGAYYFAYFLLILPLLGIMEKPKARPPSIAESVRKKHSSAPATPVAGVAPQAAE
jgi:ubiquinol-cytochrome c reductase cytochrome b subunit